MSGRINIILIFSIFFSLVGCQNDQLFDEREVFIGTWNWDFTIETQNCSPIGTDTIFSSNSSDKYTIEISRKEKVFFMINDERQTKTPIWVSDFERDTNSILSNGFRFSIYFDEESPEYVNGFISQDTLRTTPYWPPQYTNDICTSYSNYFLKE